MLSVRRFDNKQAIVVELRQGEFLFSYKTPVAGFLPGIGYFRTEKFWSRTTSHHISRYLRDSADEARTVAQEWIDARVAEL